jgi:hypothetical protein
MNSYHFMLQWVNCAKCRALWDIINRHNGPVVLGIRHIATESKFACLRNYGVKKVKICINFCYIRITPISSAQCLQISLQGLCRCFRPAAVLEASRQSDIFMGLCPGNVQVISR